MSSGEPPVKFEENSHAVQAHLEIMQSVIQRMATNSSSSKAWCLTLVSAILVIVADKGHQRFAWVAVIPTLLFLSLDAYYLALENGFCNSYNQFIQKLHERKLKAEDLFVVKPKGGQFKLFLVSISSLSVWPFYVTLLVMAYIASIFLIDVVPPKQLANTAIESTSQGQPSTDISKPKKH